MNRYSIFIDGSNLFGSLQDMKLRINDYQEFYRYIFEQSVKTANQNIEGAPPASILKRVYWYEVGSMDQWDLADPRAQDSLKKWFEKDTELKKMYMALAGEKLQMKNQEKVFLEAWALCFKEFKEWYEKKTKLLEGVKKFHHGVQSSTDFIEVIECGHWKVDLLHRSLTEKRIDTTLAVDMIAKEDNYDVALVISGDADSIPSMNYMKDRNKHVAAIEFISGYPPTDRGKTFSSKLKIAADFVVQIFEMELVSKKIGNKDSSPI